MEAIWTHEFLAGLLIGAFTAAILFVVLKRHRRFAAERKKAPGLLDLELKRAERLGYRVALLLFRPNARNVTNLRNWLETLRKDLRLREIDLVLQWSEYDLMVALPGAERENGDEALRQRFDRLLVEAGWDHVPYGIAVYPTNGEEVHKLIGHARNHAHRPKSRTGEE